MNPDRPKENNKADKRDSIRSGARFDVPYVTMNVLATVVASYGLFANSPAVVIGAMIIAMLLGPIEGVAFALVDGDPKLLRDAFLAEFGGVAIVLVTAFVLGLIHRDIPISSEILSRTSPNFLALMIALGGGAAGARRPAEQAASERADWRPTSAAAACRRAKASRCPRG